MQENILQKVVMTAFADRTVVTIAVSRSVWVLLFIEVYFLHLLALSCLFDGRVARFPSELLVHPLLCVFSFPFLHPLAPFSTQSVI